jgi:uncharacterized protein
MSLRKKINEQYSSALKNKNKNVVSTLRLVLAAIKDKDIANRTAEKKEIAKDEEIIKVLQKMKKQRQDSADFYKKGQRLDLLEVEKAEIKVIDSFLPAQLDEEETKKICKKAIETLGATSIKDMGKAMGWLKQNYSSSIDFSKASEILKSLLN